MSPSQIRTSPSPSSKKISLPELEHISSALNLPPGTTKTALDIFNKAIIEERLTRNVSLQSLTAAATYIACKQHGLKLTIEEIATASGVDKKQIDLAHNLILAEFAYLTTSTPLRIGITKFIEKQSNFSSCFYSKIAKLRKRRP